jgi:hypothetical protein
MVDQDRVGRLERRLAQEPAAGVLQLLGGDGIDALRHGGQAEVGAVGDQAGQQRPVRVAATRFVAAERLEGAGEAAPLVDVLQQVLDAHARQARPDGVAQLAHLAWDRQRVGLPQLQPAVPDRGEAVVRQAGRCRAGGPVERGGTPVEELLWIGRQVEPAVRLSPALPPAPVVVDQVPERDVLAAFGQEQVAGPQRVADRQGQGGLPDRPVDRAVLDREGTPDGGDEVARIVRLDPVAGAGIERPQDRDRRHQRFAADRGLERQRDERGQILAQRAVAGQHGVEMAALLQPVEGPAGRGRVGHGRRIDRLTEGRDGLVAVGLGQGVDSAEDAIQAGPGAPPQRAFPGLHRAVGTPVHGGQELVVHLDQLVEQAFARLDQGADDECVAFRLGEAPEVAGIVAAAELAELVDDRGIDVAEIGAFGE